MKIRKQIIFIIIIFLNSCGYSPLFYKEKGSIEKGKFADFIIIDRDIMKIETRKTPNTKVLKTYLSGELVYSNIKAN